MNGNRPKISACIIVRNEEKSLPGCLRSIRDHVDEIVVVDTGSTDGTVAVAESFGARVFLHPWENHFSRHRNQSIAYSAGEWCLIIDADEELVGGSGEQMRSAVCGVEDDVDAITAEVVSPFSGGSSTARANSIRLIRNGRGIGYRGRVHNYLVGVKKAFCSQVRILHHGYDLDQAGSARKFERTTALLRMDIEEEPDNPRPHHYLAVSCLSHGLYEEAALEASEAIRLFENSQMDPNYLWSLYVASSALLEMGRPEEAKSLAEKALRFAPLHLDSLYTLAILAFRGRNHEAFDRHMGRYLETRSLIEKEPSRFGDMVHNTFASQWILHLFRGVLLREKNDREAAQAEFKKARELSPSPFPYHFTLGRLLSESGELSPALEELNRAVELNPAETRALWFLSNVHARLGNPARQLHCIERLLALDPAFPGALFQAGLACMRLGAYEKARDHFQKARALRPSDQRTLINEALCLRGMARYEESIRLSEEARPSSGEEELALLLNRACCYEALGQEERALDAFSSLSERAPESLEPPAYLSRLFLKRSDILSCVAQCDRLLVLLGMERTIRLEKVSDLGALYLRAAEHLALSRHRDDLAGVCREIGLRLTNASHSPSHPSPTAAG